MKIPDPDCYLGFPEGQLYEALGEEKYDGLMKWMRGQTMALCEGVKNPGCHHGPDAVLYTYGVVRYLAGERSVHD